MRVKIALAIIFLAVPLLGGCWGATETDEVAYVLSMGFDKGTKDNLLVTFMVANPLATAGQAGGGGPPREIALTTSVEAIAPASSLDLMNTATTRRLSLQHTKSYIFSEELAREGLGRWLAPLNRLNDLRETANVYIVKGKASEFMEKNKPLLEMSPSKQYELIARLPYINSFFLPVQFKDFYEQVKSASIEPSMPLVAIHEGELGTAALGPLRGGHYEVGPYTAGGVPIKGKNKAQFIGMGVFRRDRMVGELTGTETRAYLVIRGKFKNATINLPDPIAGKEQYIGLRVKQGRSPEHRTTILEDGTVVVDVNVFLEAEIVAIASGINYEDPDKKPLLEKALIQHVEKRCNEIVRRSQEEFNADIFGFGYIVKHHFLTQQQWKEFNWSERYPYAQVKVKVHAKIRRTGLQLKTAPVRG